jgi:glycosyltransferase involved in cell wall biosynthesis
MRLLLVHPGAPFSVSDVYDGLSAALQRAGHQVVDYELGARIGWTKHFARLIWEENGREAGLPEPTDEDALYLAGRDLPYVAARQEVDATLVVTAAYLHPDVLAIMARAGMPVGVVFTESPYEDREQAEILPYVSIAWTNERVSAAPLSATGTPVHYLPCAYDPIKHHPPLPGFHTLLPKHDIVFVGSGFKSRLELLLAVDWEGLGIDLGLYGTWSKEAREGRLGKYIKGGITSNETAAALYREAKIGLNLYRQGEGAESLNPRAVELAACGVFTISDYRPEVAEVFGDAVPTFDGPAELEQLVRRWLADNAGRQRLAARLPAAVASRSFDQTAAQVVSQLQEVI